VLVLDFFGGVLYLYNCVRGPSGIYIFLVCLVLRFLEVDRSPGFEM